MPSRWGATLNPAALALLSLALGVMLTGCELIVEEPQSLSGGVRHEALSTGITRLPEYDAAVSAIDFVPPLSRDALLNPYKTVKLVAAVENKGTASLTALEVEARIVSQKGDFAAHDRVSVGRLSPGETKLVEFEGVAPVSTVPRSPSYRIAVTVHGRQPESVSVNNTREVIVRVAD